MTFDITFGTVIFFFFMAMPHTKRDLCSLTREPMPPAVEAQSLNHQPTREVPGALIFIKEDRKARYYFVSISDSDGSLDGGPGSWVD